MQEQASHGRKRWLAPLAALGLAAAAAFGGMFLLDWLRWAPLGTKPGLLDGYFQFEAEAIENALGNLAQVIAAVLGIVITVVSIVVQLASTRYTPRIADMFFRDRTNLGVLGFFIVAGIDAVWVSLAVKRDFVPRFTIASCLVLVTMSVLMMVPYFAYVFDFLDPEKIVSRIKEQALAAALPAHAAAVGDRKRRVQEAQSKVLGSIEQLSDVAMNALSQKDKLIAQGAVDALQQLAVSYLDGKSRAEAAWFSIGPRLRRNPDFVSMAPESVADLEMRRAWMEWKVLRQYQALYNEALSLMPDVNYLLAIDSRYIGDAALAIGDDEVLALVVKFFNTYLRATLNAGQVRTAYNVLNQYRQLCEHVIARETASGTAGSTAPAGGRALAVEIGGYLRYYGHVAQSLRLGFVTETVAYDIATLCERAFLAGPVGSACHDQLLDILLTVDQKAATGEQERALRGIRKAQVKLATFYLATGAEANARKIAADLRDEPAARLRLIRDELEAVRTRDFWEVIDRGTNFDYLDEARRPQLAVFFGWFPALQPGAAAAAASS